MARMKRELGGKRGGRGGEEFLGMRGGFEVDIPVRSFVGEE